MNKKQNYTVPEVFEFELRVTAKLMQTSNQLMQTSNQGRVEDIQGVHSGSWDTESE